MSSVQLKRLLKNSCLLLIKEITNDKNFNLYQLSKCFFRFLPPMPRNVLVLICVEKRAASPIDYSLYGPANS